MSEHQDNIFGIDLRKVRVGSVLWISGGPDLYYSGTAVELPSDVWRGRYKVKTEVGEEKNVEADDIARIVKR